MPREKSARAFSIHDECDIEDAIHKIVLGDVGSQKGGLPTEPLPMHLAVEELVLPVEGGIPTEPLPTAEELVEQMVSWRMGARRLPAGGAPLRRSSLHKGVEEEPGISPSFGGLIPKRGKLPPPDKCALQPHLTSHKPTPGEPAAAEPCGLRREEAAPEQVVMPTKNTDSSGGLEIGVSELSYLVGGLLCVVILQGVLIALLLMR